MVDTTHAETSAKLAHNLRGAILWTAGILVALGLAWFVGTVAIPVWQTRTVLYGQFTIGGSPMERRSVLIDRLGGPERAPARLRLYLQMPEFLAPDKYGAQVLLMEWVDPAAVRQFLADAADGRHDGRELIDRSQQLFGSERYIPDHATLFRSLPCEERDGTLTYRLEWREAGREEPVRLAILIAPRGGEIVDVRFAVRRFKGTGERREPNEGTPPPPQ